MRKTFLRIGSLLAFLAVILGAFGAHALEALISADQLNTFETGVRYQFYHAFAILIVGLAGYFRQTNLLRWSGWLFLTGTVLFSGSIYLLSMKELFAIPTSILGPVTPVGGTILITAWALFFISTFQKNEHSHKHSEH
jgi:uncharacterized membrane protein YgdD (TMEM256/DUF423 family)